MVPLILNVSDQLKKDDSRKVIALDELTRLLTLYAVNLREPSTWWVESSGVRLRLITCHIMATMSGKGLHNILLNIEDVLVQFGF